MKKAGFTIIELVIAIGIFSIIIVYMYKAVATTKKSNTIYEKRYQLVRSHEKLKKVIYNDIFNQVDPYKDLSFSGGFLYLRTKNSLHNIINPYVVYGVKDKKLIRIESLQKMIFPIESKEQSRLLEVDVFLENIQDFKVFAKKNSYLFSWLKGENRSLFQIKLPYYRKVILVKSKADDKTK